MSALPASAATERALRKLRREILDMSGTAILLSCDVLAGESDVRNAFQAARNDEYEEIVDRCEDFLHQVQKEYTDSHFTYAELEENEVDLVKLRNWFAKVRERDAFDGGGDDFGEPVGRFQASKLVGLAPMRFGEFVAECDLAADPARRKR